MIHSYIYKAAKTGFQTSLATAFVQQTPTKVSPLGPASSSLCETTQLTTINVIPPHQQEQDRQRKLESEENEQREQDQEKEKEERSGKKAD